MGQISCSAAKFCVFDSACATTALVMNQYPENHQRHDMSVTTNRLLDAPATTTPSGVADVSAARQLIGTGMGSADARHLAPFAIQRWEAEGGALGAISHA